MRTRKNLATALCGLVLTGSLPALALTQDVKTKIDIVANRIGAPPGDFEFWRTGGGDLGRWTVVSDVTARDETAIEHASADTTEGRFPLAVYKPVSFRNVTVSARFKIVSGTLLSAGIALRLVNVGSYYVVSASALETRVDLYRVIDGKSEQITGVDADVFRERWHMMQVIADDDRFTVVFDNQPLFTAWDRTFRHDGQIALWTAEDNVTRFDQIEITPLPWSEPR
jgi:hypothetical protein